MKFGDAVRRSIASFIDGKLPEQMFDAIEAEEIIYTPQYFDELEAEQAKDLDEPVEEEDEDDDNS
jgi:hypothetical protein